MKPFRTQEELEANDPLWRFSPYASGRVQVLLSIRAEILQNLDGAFSSVIDYEKVERAESLVWLWVLGAYEVVRTMSQARACFSARAVGVLITLKRELASARMPAAKMELPGKSTPVTSQRSPCAFDVASRDLLIGSPDALVSARRLLSLFYAFVEQLSASDVLRPHEAAYPNAS